MRLLDLNIEREKPKEKVVQFLGWGYLIFGVVLLVSLLLPSMTFFDLQTLMKLAARWYSS